MPSETHGFQTEAKKLLSLVINSLYSNREVFLRELISNASDAIDKLRFELLSNPDLVDGNPDFRITVDFDDTEHTISIADNGIGMTREEVIENLGTIAKSGTEEFLDSLTGDEQADAHLIGQFGVGFYSVFMVADEVRVTTKRAGTDTATLWISSGEDSFTVQDTEFERGTRITLHLKADAHEFADSYRLREIVRRYSDHISVPVQMVAVADDEDKYETINTATALWTRSRSEISDDEYKEFYKHISHDFDDPAAWSHNRVEGRLDYTSLIYIPKRAPFDLYQPEAPRGLKLYVQRVFIMDDAETFLPMYLRWVKGVVDSNDLPLNVSRELLQENDHVASIRSALTRRVVDKLNGLAKDDSETYGEIWDQFGSVLKEGIRTDSTNAGNLLDLYRFASTHSEGSKQRVTLKDYVARAPADQEKIYYLFGESEASARVSPQLEVFRARNIEVLLLTDLIDPWMASSLPEYEGKQFQDITKEELSLPGQEQEESKDDDEPADSEEAVISRAQGALSDRVASVRKSTRLTDSPACLVFEQFDMPHQVTRAMRASGQAMPVSKPHLEINLDHALIRHLAAQEDDGKFNDIALVVFDHAALADGFEQLEAGPYVQRVNRLLVDLIG